MPSPATPDQLVSTPSQGYYQRKRKRGSMNTRSGSKSPANLKPPSTPVRPRQSSPRKKNAKVMQKVVEKVDKMDNDVVKEPSGKQKIKFESLLQRAEELQGYLNQLQDAVTIAMCQLRELKTNVTAALESAEKL